MEWSTVAFFGVAVLGAWLYVARKALERMPDLDDPDKHWESRRERYRRSRG